MPRAHVDRHPSYVEGCFGCKLVTLQYQGKRPSPTTMMEARWERDMPAYHRLRMQGLQPPHIDGCALLEQQATTQHEIELGALFTPEQMPSVERGMEIARDMADFAEERGVSTLVRPPPP